MHDLTFVKGLMQKNSSRDEGKKEEEWTNSLPYTRRDRDRFFLLTYEVQTCFFTGLRPSVTPQIPKKKNFCILW
jgi:hypothetical protein